LDERLPRLDLFDHVIVRAVIGGKVYWLDGTRRGDRSLDAIPAPAFRWALPVRPQGAALETISQSPFDQPQTEIVARLDASGGLDTPASAHVEAIFRGDAGIGMRLALASAGREDAERYVKEFWTRSFPWINAARVDFSPDEANGVTRLSLDGAANMDWSSDGSAREFNIAESGLGADTAFRREPGPDDDAPFAVSYPAFAKSTVTVILPRQGENFQLAGGGDVDKTVAGVAYHRRSRLEKGVVTMEASTRSLKPEFAFADGPIAQAGLRQLAEADVLIRTVDTPAAGGPARVTATVMPRDAAGFGARGSAYLMQRDYGHAIADFTTAMRLAPGAAKYAYNRGVAHFEKGESVLALADFDHAVALNPKDELAASARGQIFLARGDQLAAQKAFAQAIALAPDHPDALWRAANAFDEAGKFQIAIQYYDDLIRRFPADTHLAQMLNARCWTRGESGQELDIALGDCEAALKLAPGSANILDSRAFVELRLSQLDKAITDYDDALAREPSEADSLYGRGLAKARKGLKADSARDLTEATRLEPTIAAKYSAYGLRP